MRVLRPAAPAGRVAGCGTRSPMLPRPATGRTAGGMARMGTGTLRPAVLTAATDLTPDPGPGGGYAARFWYRYETETGERHWDQRWVQIAVNDGEFEHLLQLSDDEPLVWLQSPAIDPSGDAGETVQLRVSHFTTLDAANNDPGGWWIDDFSVTAIPPWAAATPTNRMTRPKTLDSRLCANRERADLPGRGPQFLPDHRRARRPGSDRYQRPVRWVSPRSVPLPARVGWHDDPGQQR